MRRMEDEDLINLCAFRYALGRMGYIVSVVAEWLAKADLCDEAKRLIVTEIEEAEERERRMPELRLLGDDWDKWNWLKLKEQFKEELQQKQE